MATATKKCKVCGNEYEYCHTVRRVPGVFRWQDVACCPEHGSIYLANIRASREQSNIIFEEIDEYKDEDLLFEDDFEEDENEDFEITM